MKSAAMVIGVLSVVAGAAITLIMLVFILAGSANSKPEEWPMIRGWLIGCGTGGLICFIGGIWLLATGLPWWGASVGALPILGCIVALVWILAS